MSDTVTYLTHNLWWLMPAVVVLGAVCVAASQLLGKPCGRRT